MNKVETSVERIWAWHKQWPRGVVMFSGGKDSTVMLHLIRFIAGIDIPVVQYREPKFRHRYAYSDKLVRDWGLEMYDYSPSRLELASGPDVVTGEMRFDLLKYYQWGKQTALILSLGTERPKDGEPYLCAVSDYFARPKGTFEWPWEAAYLGTKRSDSDLIKGDVPLKQDIRILKDGPVNLYPISDWTDSDIFGYMEHNGIEPDPTRYVKRDGVWGNNPDKSLNADFYPVCVNCVDRHQQKHVFCPKLRATITNISESVPYGDVEFPDLGFKRTWKDEKGTVLNDAG